MTSRRRSYPLHTNSSVLSALGRRISVDAIPSRFREEPVRHDSVLGDKPKRGRDALSPWVRASATSACCGVLSARAMELLIFVPCLCRDVSSPGGAANSAEHLMQVHA